jgi:23S rRNA (guanosine2251-2'-O)-methyltransferase
MAGDGRRQGRRQIYGYHPVREALRQRPQSVERVLIAGGRGADDARGKPATRRSEIAELCARHRVEVKEVSFAQLRDVLDQGRGDNEVTHNGFVAQLVDEQQSGRGETTGDPDLVVLVEDVQDPRNLGALLRVCEAAGVGRVLIRDRGSAPITSVVEKTAAGAVSWLQIERITNTGQELERLKKDGYWVYGTDAGGEPPWQLDLTGKVVLCFGGEEKGLRQRTRGLCDGHIGLPMKGRIESLNLSTAVSAVLFDAVRQRA